MTAAEFPLHLFRLASPGLPVGGFSYSRGLESAIDRGWVHDEQSAQEWILGVFEQIYSALDGPLFVRMMDALAAGDSSTFLRNDEWLRASRESEELQLEDLRMGKALQRLLRDLAVPVAAGYAHVDLSYPAAFALAAHHWNIPATQALQALMWSTMEAQVTAAMRLVPLGQTAGQRMMINAVNVIARGSENASQMSDDEIGNTAPSLAMASAWHEVQYSRLFRS